MTWFAEKINDDGTHSYHFKTTVPYVNHLTSFVIGEYTDVPQVYQNIQLHNYGYKHEAEETKASTERLPDMMKYFSEVTGKLYPYKSYAQVFVQDLPGWIGSNAFSIITENMVDDYTTHADFFYLWDLTEAEALVSQWFGNYISCSNWSDVWLNRAFSHYFNLLYNEQKNGKDEFLAYLLSFDHANYLSD